MRPSLKNNTQEINDVSTLTSALNSQINKESSDILSINNKFNVLTGAKIGFAEIFSPKKGVYLSFILYMASTAISWVGNLLIAIPCSDKLRSNPPSS